MENKHRMIFSIIAGIFHHFSMSAINRMGSLAVYYVSYLHKTDMSITLYYGMMMMSVCSFSLTLAVAPGAFIEKRLGPYYTIILGASISLIANCAMFFGSINIGIGYLVMIINGIGSGIPFLITIKNACMYDESRKGMIAGVIMSIGQLGGPVFVFLGETIINPTSVAIGEGEEFFTYDIAKNFFVYNIIMFLVFPCGIIMTMLCFYTYEKDEVEKGAIIEMTEIKQIDEVNNIQEPAQNREGVARKSEEYKRNLKKIFTSGRVYMISTVYFCTGFLYFLIIGTSKTMGSINNFSTDILKYSSAVGGVLLCSMGPIWGYLYDKFRFKILLTIIDIAGIGIGILTSISLINEWFFAIMTVINGIFFVGMMNIFNPHVMKVYTIAYSMEVGGLLAIANGLSNMIGSLFAFIITCIFSKENAKWAYIAMLIIGSVMSLISLILSRFEDENEFQLENNQTDDNTSMVY